MKSTKCGYNDNPPGTGQALLALNGPTIFVDVGYDPTFKSAQETPPVTTVQKLSALVDTGASESCIDNSLALALNLPVVDRQPIAGSNGSHEVNFYVAQIYIPTLHYTIWGRFAGVELIAGGQVHQALLGRTFLANFNMMYEGATGNVTLSST